MRWGAMTPSGVYLMRRARNLGYRVLIALVVLGLVLWLSRVVGLPERLTREGINYLLTKHYDFSSVITRVADYLGDKPGLDVKVMGPLEDEKSASQKLPDLPVTGRLARGFGWQRDQYGWPRFYQGIELRVSEGAPVCAVLPGRVTRVMEDRALGKVVVIEHLQQAASLYGRLGNVGVKAGEEVAQGQMIGTVAGSYFHFELRRGDRLVDPIVELQHAQ